MAALQGVFVNKAAIEPLTHAMETAINAGNFTDPNDTVTDITAFSDTLTIIEAPGNVLTLHQQKQRTMVLNIRFLKLKV